MSADELGVQIGQLREHLRAVPGDADAHGELGVALWKRFGRDGSHRDIFDSMDHLLSAASLAPWDTDAPRYLANVGTSFLTLGERTHDEETLTAAITAFLKALEFIAREDPGWPLCMTNLGMALHFRHVVTGSAEDVAEAVKVLRQAVQDTPHYDSSRPGRLTTLCMALNSSFEVTHNPAELSEAIERGKEALRTLPHSSIHRARALANVGLGYETRFRQSGDERDRLTAMDYLEGAAASPASSAWDRFRPARGWALFAEETADYSAATTAFTRAIELLQLVAWPGLELTDQLSYLRAVGVPGLASEAAACAIAARKPDVALQLLDQGRGVLLGHILNLRTDLSALARQDRALADELHQCRSQLDGGGELDSDVRRDLVRQWDALVAQARRIPGFEDFLGLPPLETLLSAASGGTVVVVNVSKLRCDALIVTDRGVELQPLPDLTSQRASEQAERYLGALQRFERAGQQYRVADRSFQYHGGTQQIHAATKALRQADRSMKQTLDEVLAWLWDVVGEPVLGRLGITQSPEDSRPWPRLWWCLTGPLTLLPLHAAGNVMDRVVPSYTPTLRALAEAKRRVRNDNLRDARMLIVAAGELPNQPALSEVARERDLLTRLFPETKHTLLDGRAATRAAVATELSRHCWVHLSCHGTQDLADPTRGGLLLADGMLTFADITAGRYYGEYAFLSACKTAISGWDFADETITIAAALHYAGYRHVIATLWAVGETAAADLASLLYTDLTSTGAFAPDRTAYALHRAVRTMRAKAGSPLTWLAFAHVGP